VVPPLAPAWEPRGTVSGEGAAAFGLRKGVPVATGWSDALAAMLAVGVFDEPAAFVLAGTSSIVGRSSPQPASGSARLLRIPATCAPLDVTYGPTESAGASIDWLARLLRCDAGTVLALAASATERDDLPVFVPYIAGERAPVWRTDVRAVVHGLSSEDGPAELALAVVLGVCLSELDVLSTVEEDLGADPADVCVAGRGVSQPPWLAARLAALARPLRLLDEEEATALGAAMLGAAAASGGDLVAARPLRGRIRDVAPDAPAREVAAAALATYRRTAAASLAAGRDARLPWPRSSS
jgi:xylulokinase